MTQITLLLAPGQIPRHRHAETGRDRGRRVRRAERIVVALGSLGEAGQAAALPQGAEFDHGGRSGSCADTLDDRRPRSSDRAAYRTRGAARRSSSMTPGPRPEVAASDRNRVDRLLSQLVGKLPQLDRPGAAQVVGRLRPDPEVAFYRLQASIRRTSSTNVVCVIRRLAATETSLDTDTAAHSSTSDATR